MDVDFPLEASPSQAQIRANPAGSLLSHIDIFIVRIELSRTFWSCEHFPISPVLIHVELELWSRKHSVLAMFDQSLDCQQLDVKASAGGATGGSAGGSAAESGGDISVDDGPGRQADIQYCGSILARSASPNHWII